MSIAFCSAAEFLQPISDGFVVVGDKNFCLENTKIYLTSKVRSIFKRGRRSGKFTLGT